MNPSHSFNNYQPIFSFLHPFPTPLSKANCRHCIMLPFQYAILVIPEYYQISSLLKCLQCKYYWKWYSEFGSEDTLVELVSCVEVPEILNQSDPIVLEFVIANKQTEMCTRYKNPDFQMFHRKKHVQLHPELHCLVR